MKRAARTGVDSGQTLATYLAAIGDRWTRGIDPTSTYDPYAAGLKRRVVPTLGHLPVSMITAGLVDRAIDEWETKYGRSTVKNSVAALVLVLDEAVRDGLIVRNPAKDRAPPAHSRPHGCSAAGQPTRPRPARRGSPRATRGPCHRGRRAPSYGDVVTILATTALRISEVSGLRVGDVDLAGGLLHVDRQTYPGRGGLVTKPTKGRRRRTVPIIEPLRPTLARPTVGRREDEPLVMGPRGGVITTATLRDATNWDAVVQEIVGRASSGTVFGTPRSLGWPMPASSCISFSGSLDTSDPAVTARYLHPDTCAVLEAGAAFSRWWSEPGPERRGLGVVDGGQARA